MKQSDIIRVYDYMKANSDVKERMLQNVLFSASVSSLDRKEIKMKRTNLKKFYLVAAILSIMMLLMGCAVVLYTLQDLQIGEYTQVVPKYTDEEGKKIKDFEIKKDVISLQGIKGSPSQMAAQEWYEFESNYDNNYELLNEADKNPIDVSREYDAYFVYTQEMIDKIDEITEKYGLKLAGEVTAIQRDNPEIFYESLGIQNLLKDGAFAELEFCGGYFYACGNFKAEFDLLLTGEEASWDYAVNGSIRYCGKAYLDTVFAHISAVENFDQWIYKLPNSTDVLIVTGDEHAMILCDTQTAFISVLVQTMHCDENNVLTHMSKRDIELVADAMDFSIVPQKPYMVEVNRRIEEAYIQWKAEQEAKYAEDEDPLAPKSSYSEKIQSLLHKGVNPDHYYYALYDVNGDGIEDLFLSCEKDSFGPIYTMYNGKTYTLLSHGLDKYSYLCENGIVLHNDLDSNPNGYYFYKLGEITGDGMEADLIDTVSYDDWDECWKRSLGGYYGTDQVITESEAIEVIESYGRVELEMKSLAEYPMN